MDWKTFIAQIINTLAWPIVLIIFLYFFKEQIQNLIRSLTKLTIGNNTAVFGKEKAAEEVSSKNKDEQTDSEEESSISKKDILSIPDDDFEFMQAIAENKNFMPVSESEIFKYNSLVNHGYFDKGQDNEYKPTNKGAEIIAVLKSIYH